MKDLAVAAKETVSLELVLLLDGNTVTVGILAYDDGLDTEDGRIKVIMSGDKIRKLPIP